MGTRPTRPWGPPGDAPGSSPGSPWNTKTPIAHTIYSAKSSPLVHPSPFVATLDSSEPRDLPDTSEILLGCAWGTRQATLSCVLRK